MRVVQINSVSGIRSTGRICLETAKLLKEKDDECLIIFGREKAGIEAEEFSIRIGNEFTNILHYLTYILTDDDARGSIFPTKKAIRLIEDFKPDVIHIHNLHGHYINSYLLLKYIKEHEIPALFSLYDCWTFTGGCTHFDYIGCDKWKTKCDKCPYQTKYPLDGIMKDASKENYEFKKMSFDSIKNKIISPGSYWLEELVRQSFLKDSIIETVRSGIDLQRFRYKDSNIAKKYHIEKPIVLLVASQWSINKGLRYLPSLAEALQEKYCIVVIGELREKISLPKSVIHIPQTHNLDEMVSWYSCASIFVNLTLQETLGLTNVEALACGTPVVTFDSGGCKECVDSSCGIVVPRGDLKGIIEGINNVFQSKTITKESCRKKSEEFDKTKAYLRYLDLYAELREMHDGK